ncbi:MAG: FAD-binding oxidoreductase, partial [Niameybacter sp.]
MDPFVDSLDGELEGKKVALFGSYGWGGGEWMRLWEDRIREYGGEIIGEGLTINGVPGDDDASCIEYGKLIAKHLCGECIESKVCTEDENGDPTCWDGFKSLVVFNKVQESDKITSFYMKAEDGSELPKAKPGQYIAIKYKDINGEYSDVRQYTLSMNSNEDYYRISVKNEEKGKVSKGLCSSIDVGGIIESTVPMGVFTLKEGEEPIVLIAGGIGVTPILSMALAAREENRKVKLIYSVSNSDSH